MPENGKKRQQNEGCEAPAELCSFLPEKLVRLHLLLRLCSSIATQRRRFSDDFHNGSQSLESLPTPHTPPILRPVLPTPNPFPSFPFLIPKILAGPLRGTLWGFLAGALDGGGAAGL